MQRPETDGYVRLEDLEGRDDLHGACLAAVARARGIPAEFIKLPRPSNGKLADYLRLEIGNAVFLYRTGVIMRLLGRWPLRRHINGPLPRLSIDKWRTRTAVLKRGFPAPDGRLFRAHEFEAAMAYFRQRKGPMCLKPSRGRQGKMVFPRLDDEVTFRKAFRRAAKRHRWLILEEHLEGASIRMFYARPDIVAVREDVPANVYGDGHSTIDQLVILKNEERIRRALPSHRPLSINAEEKRYLKTRGLTPDSVPSAGERILLRGTSNIPTGGDCLTIPGSVHPSYKEEMRRMCQAFPIMNVSAVDMLLLDPLSPARPDNYAVLEINSSPGVVPFYFPWEGVQYDVCGAMLDMLCEEAARPPPLSRLWHMVWDWRHLMRV